MAQNQISQMLQDELDKMSQAMNRGLKQLDQRLRKLEQPDNGSQSDDGADLSEQRRKAWQEVLNKYKDGSTDKQSLQARQPLCTTCKLGMIQDGEIMQYSNAHDYPNYIPGGFLFCQAMKTNMPLRSAPRTVCMMKEPDQNDPKNKAA